MQHVRYLATVSNLTIIINAELLTKEADVKCLKFLGS